MRRQLILGLTMIIGGLVTIAMVVMLTRLSPIATTLAALFLLVLLLTFVMPELTLHIVVLSMLLSPEIAISQIPGTRGGHAELTLRIEDFLLMFLGMGWLARLAIFKEITQITRSPINGPILTYLAVCVISTLLGVVIGQVSPAAGSLYLLKYFEYYFLYYMVIMTVDDEAQVRRLTATFFITAIIIIATAVAQIPAGNRVGTPFEGGGGEPNTLGGYLLIVLAMALGFLSHSVHYWSNMAWAGLAFFTLIPLGYTLSRVSWVALVPLIIVYVIVNYKRRIFMVTLGTLMGITLILLLAPSSLKDRVDARIDQTFTPGARSEQVVESVFGTPLDESTSLRIRRYKEVIEPLSHNPLFGSGITGWGMADAMYPRVLGETGILGFAAFMWLLFRMAKENRRAAQYFADHPATPLQLSLISGQLLSLAAVVAHAAGADTFVIVRIMEPFWLITALTFVLPYVRPRNALEVSTETATPEPDSSQREHPLR